MKAVVMAGGAGSRLRPMTVNRPKPMVSIVNKPVIEHILELLKRHGITEVVITLHFMAETIQDYFGDGSAFGMHIDYSIEETPLGTAGSVKQAQHLLDETFVVISGDAVTDIDLTKVIEYHQAKKAKATLTLYRVPSPLEYGVVITDEEGRIRQFLEKPSWGEVISDTVNTGIYVIEPDMLDYFEDGCKFDFSQDLFPILLDKDDPMYGYVAEGYWCDVGNLAEYMRASGDILDGAVDVGDLGDHPNSGLWCGEGVEIAPDAQLYGPIYLGDGVKIKQGVIVHGPTVVQDYTVVDRFAHIERSVIQRNCYVGETVEMRGAIVGQQVSLKRKVVLFEGVVIGDRSVLGEGAVIHPSVKIWPDKEVEAGATVNYSIIWGAQGRHVLFGRFGVTGLVNVDLTPELAARLGASFGATLDKGSAVTVSRDMHRSSRMLKRGIMAGLASSGINALDLGASPIPVTRFVTRQSISSGGIHVRLSPYDQRVVDIKFFGEGGQDLSKGDERGIERAFFREDFRRTYLNEIGTIDYPEHVRGDYQNAFMEAINSDAIRAANPHIAVDFANAPTAEVMAPLLTSLNCRMVALNEALDENKIAISPAEFRESINQLGKICSVLQTAMGVRFDVGGERIFVVNCGGEQVSSTLLSAALAAMALKSNGGGQIAVPVSMPDVFERIAESFGGEVIRTKVNLESLMQAANQEGVVMACDGVGSFIWPQFQPVVDGMMTLAKMLEYATTQNMSLSDIIASVPEYHMVQGQVDCPWGAKGQVMRLLNQQYKDSLAERIDGVKIRLGDGQWVLVLPDADRPLFHIFAQAQSDEQASDLVGRYQRIVDGLQN